MSGMSEAGLKRRMTLRASSTSASIEAMSCRRDEALDHRLGPREPAVDGVGDVAGNLELGRDVAGRLQQHVEVDALQELDELLHLGPQRLRQRGVGEQLLGGLAQPRERLDDLLLRLLDAEPVDGRAHAVDGRLERGEAAGEPVEDPLGLAGEPVDLRRDVRAAR